MVGPTIHTTAIWSLSRPLEFLTTGLTQHSIKRFPCNNVRKNPLCSVFANQSVPNIVFIAGILSTTSHDHCSIIAVPHVQHRCLNLDRRQHNNCALASDAKLFLVVIISASGRHVKLPTAPNRHFLPRLCCGEKLVYVVVMCLSMNASSITCSIASTRSIYEPIFVSSFVVESASFCSPSNSGFIGSGRRPTRSSLSTSTRLTVEPLLTQVFFLYMLGGSEPLTNGHYGTAPSACLHSSVGVHEGHTL